MRLCIGRDACVGAGAARSFEVRVNHPHRARRRVHDGRLTAPSLVAGHRRPLRGLSTVFEFPILTASGRDAIGARITVTFGKRKQIDEVRSGGYHISQGDFRVHFGLGSAEKADVTIRWPQGAIETFKDVAANQLIVAREGKGIVERRPLAPRSQPRSSRVQSNGKEPSR
jgi:hypothetical protein